MVNVLMKQFWMALIGVMLVPTSAHADDRAAKQQLAPTEKLRVAIAVGPAPSGIYAVKDQQLARIAG